MDGLAWFVAGVPVDVFDRSPDAEFILATDFAEERDIELSAIAWRECSIPIQAFGLTGQNLTEHIARVPRLRGQQSEQERLEAIREWVEAAGGMEAALRASPLIVTMSAQGALHVEDGWHRLGLAVFESGLTHVLAVCAIVPEPVPVCRPRN